jgi:putative endonuclease
MGNLKVKSKKIKSYRFGIIAEYIAIIFLFFKGYKILCRRFKNKLGEVDIIAKKGKSIIAIEVKARRKKVHEKGFLLDEVLTQNQKNRIKRAMFLFMKINSKKYQNHSFSFDLVVISPYKMPLHLINFWE